MIKTESDHHPSRERDTQKGMMMIAELLIAYCDIFHTTEKPDTTARSQ